MRSAGQEQGGPRPPKAEAIASLLRRLYASQTVQGADAFAHPRPGDRLGSLELVREIGRGGSSVVYEARDGAVEQVVAVKILAPREAPEDGDERGLREAEAAGSLSHANIVKVLDTGRCPAGPYLVLERLEGQSLSRWLGQGAIPLREALRIALEIARALSHAHARGVVHRDLSPANVFLCDGGGVKVLDFGLAHVVGRRKLDGGTDAYMAPEQARRAPEDERTDVFALGVMLFQMVSGRLPFHAGRSAREAGRRGLELRIPGAPALAALVKQMLSQDPVKRPRDGAEVLERLGALQRRLDSLPDGGRRIAVRTVWRRTRTPARSMLRTIAVLPFVDMSEHQDQRYLSDGIAEEVLLALTRVRGLRVAGRTSSFRFKDARVDARTVGRRLGVSAVLEGSLRRDGDRIRVAARLVDARDGLRIWSQTFDRELTDVFAAQDEIAAAVAEALSPLGGEGWSTRERVTTNVEAYRAYLIGRQFRTRGATRENLRRAIDAFGRALELDARFAPAWAGLADALHVESDHAESPARLEELQRRALFAAERAITLGPRLADGYRQRGILRRARCDWVGAQADLRRARQLGPDDAGTSREEGRLRAALGRLREAIRLLHDAIRVDPLDARNWYFLGAVHLGAGELAQARAAYRRAWEVAPDSVGAPFGLGLVALLEQDPMSARALFTRAGDMGRLLGLVVAEHDLDHPAASDVALAELTRRYGFTSPCTVAKAHAWRGELDLAFAFLDQAQAQHDPALIAIKHDPLLRDARLDRRHRVLLERMNLPVD